MRKKLLLLLTISLFVLSGSAQDHFSYTTGVLVVGGGTGGISAGIQCARMGVPTLIAEPSPWLGGMLTAAGVSATDGNYQLHSGIWEEFREALYRHYGGAGALQTGWVSLIQFEPHVGDSIFKALAARERYLQVLYGLRFVSVLKEGAKIKGAVFENLSGKAVQVHAQIVIDATDLGDVLKEAGAAYDLGMDARSASGEKQAPPVANDIIQDLTYVAILKDYGVHNPYLITQEPKGYDPSVFRCSCKKGCEADTGVLDCNKMIQYGRLPNNKYMINWPRHGNDSYLNIVALPDSVRIAALQLAKAKTLHFIYYIQHELGFNNLGLADDEFPTSDQLPFIPYHREGRRVRGLVRLNVNHLLDPYHQLQPLYRTAIAVGDYPIDHHHQQYPGPVPKIDFPSVPSFSIPLGALVPEKVEGLVIADKGISVTNIVNGATRLQPCVLVTGQAAGALAALSVLHRQAPQAINIREVQEVLLHHKAYLLPFIDVAPDQSYFEACQRIGVTGILKGKGVPYQWANQTWFYPDSTILQKDFCEGLTDFDHNFRPPEIYCHKKGLTIADAMSIIKKYVNWLRRHGQLKSVRFANKWMEGEKGWSDWGLPDYKKDRLIRRWELAVLLDKTLDPFHLKQVNWSGQWQ